MHLYEVFNNKLSLTEAGKGIAFTIPVSGASGTAFSLGGTSPEKEEITKMSDVKYELIVTIVNRGGFEKVKEAAKRAGARGGTLIHGLGLGGEEAAKFLGISIQPEKDVVLIVVGKDEREQVMQKIMEEAGILTENRGICFSLPVDTALGLAGKTGSIEDMVK
jgi:nitrogen regulatory protein PII